MTTKECEFWLSWDADKEKFRFPVLPESINITCGIDNESVNVSGLGEVTIIQDPGAKTFDWSCHFPATVHQGVAKSIREDLSLLKTPQEYIDLLEKWRASKKPVMFTVNDPVINMYCSINSFEYSEKGGDPGTFYYSIKLKEYREVTVRKLDTTPVVAAGDPSTDEMSGGALKTGKVKTKGSRLKMYKKKSASSKVLKKIKNGSTVGIISTSGSWRNITYSGKTGWAKKKYIK